MGSQIDERDLRVIQGQLGREPRGVLEIERRCRWGYPQAVKVYPLLRESCTPFPTLFWLTCPFIAEQLGRLESQGYVKELERLISTDESLREGYYQGHRDYIAERWATLSKEDRALLEESGSAATLRARGIGGLADWGRVKCLHLHYAHHLARGNAIGRWVENHLPLEECPPRASPLRRI